MYIYQNGKLYIQDEDALVGIEIHPHTGISRVIGEDTVLSDKFECLTRDEVYAKFGILSGLSYKFPKEISKNDTSRNIQRPTRGRPRKQH